MASQRPHLAHSRAAPRPKLGFALTVAALFLGTFTAVLLWDSSGNPVSTIQAAPTSGELALANAPDAETLRRQRWPDTAESIEAGQPLANMPIPGGDAGQGSGAGSTDLQGTAITASFSRCGGGARINCVVDGDTIWANGTKIRMADYNSPEIGNPSCTRERQLGERATTRLIGLLNSGTVTLHSSGGRNTDSYGRALREVHVGGRSVGDALMAEGLAHAWRGQREGWC